MILGSVATVSRNHPTEFWPASSRAWVCAQLHDGHVVALLKWLTGLEFLEVEQSCVLRLDLSLPTTSSWSTAGGSTASVVSRATSDSSRRSVRATCRAVSWPDRLVRRE